MIFIDSLRKFSSLKGSFKVRVRSHKKPKKEPTVHDEKWNFIEDNLNVFDIISFKNCIEKSEEKESE